MSDPPPTDPSTPPPAGPPTGPAAGGSRWELTGNALEELLTALDPDRDAAGAKYVEIRQRLVRLFAWRGCGQPDELADETINRVAHKLAEGVEIRADDPFRFFCGVAFLVFKEILRREGRERRALDEVRRSPPPPDPSGDGDDLRLSCLRRCLAGLDDDERSLILVYHRSDGGRRIRDRKQLAVRLAIPINALRIRAHRLRLRLEACVTLCLERAVEV